MIKHDPIPGHLFGEATYQHFRTGDDSIFTFAEAGLLRGNTIRCDSEKQVCAIERSRPQSQNHLSVDLSLSRADTIIFAQIYCRLPARSIKYYFSVSIACTLRYLQSRITVHMLLFDNHA
jgi:hypothetical protein